MLRVFAICVAFVGSFGSVFAQTPAEVAGWRASELLAVIREECHLPGVSAAVAMDGRVVWADGVGFADLETRTSAGPETVYRLASISKAITGVVVASLADEGLIDLDTPIATYLPDFPVAADRITVRMLMGHISGMRSYTAEERDDLSPRRYETVEEALETFTHDPLVHEPGERWLYTTLGYIPVRAIVERVTGESFMDVVRARVLEPAGMGRTWLDDNRRITEGRAAFYALGEGGRFINAPYIDTSYKPAGGGLVGSAVDLCALTQSLATSTLLSDDAKRELWRPTVTESGEEIDYGLGWGLATDPRGVDYVVQIGGQIGTSSITMLYPDAGVSSAMITNRASGPTGRAEGVAFSRLFMDTADGVSPAIPDVPGGVYRVRITHDGLAWGGAMTLAEDRGRVLGEISVVNTENDGDRRRFRIATATASRDGGFRLFTVHPSWGVFPFDLAVEGDRIAGTLDRAEDGAWAVEAWPLEPDTSTD